MPDTALSNLLTGYQHAESALPIPNGAKTPLWRDQGQFSALVFNSGRTPITVIPTKANPDPPTNELRPGAGPIHVQFKDEIHVTSKGDGGQVSYLIVRTD